MSVAERGTRAWHTEPVTRNSRRRTRPEFTDDELLAFEIVARNLDVKFEPYDRDGRQGAVDAILRYPDGRMAALEVSSVGSSGEAEICNVLAKKENAQRRPRGLKRSWWVQVPRDFKPRNLPRIDGAVRRCEMYGSPTFMAAIADDLVRELVVAGVQGKIMTAPSHPPVVQVEPEYLGGFTSNGGRDLPAEFNAMLRDSTMRRKIDKLAASGHSERHLFLHVRPSAFSFPVYDTLAWGGPLPDEPPTLPAGLDQVWLISLKAGGVVRAVAGHGWRRTPALV